MKKSNLIFFLQLYFSFFQMHNLFSSNWGKSLMHNISNLSDLRQCFLYLENFYFHLCIFILVVVLGLENSVAFSSRLIHQYSLNFNELFSTTCNRRYMEWAMETDTDILVFPTVKQQQQRLPTAYILWTPKKYCFCRFSLFLSTPKYFFTWSFLNINVHNKKLF